MLLNQNHNELYTTPSLTRRVLYIYYTDWHDVDEDVQTIAGYGGYWGNGDSGRAGVFKRDVFYTITSTIDIVASMR